MSVASTRISLQWPPEAPFENTDTLVLVSNESHFVDIRVLKDHKSSSSKLPIDWVITGKEHEVPNSNKIEFQHEINTHVKGNYGGAFDTGAFNEIPGSNDREELGEMENLDTGKVQPYREVWRSLDPLKSTPSDYVEEDPSAKNVPCTVFKVKNEEYLGSVVRLGNFQQGALLNKSNGEYSVTRYFLDNDEWKAVFQYGDEVSKIPVETAGEKSIKLDNIEWELVESNL